jgi:hypothetical protein
MAIFIMFYAVSAFLSFIKKKTEMKIFFYEKKKPKHAFPHIIYKKNAEAALFFYLL